MNIKILLSFLLAPMFLFTACKESAQPMPEPDALSLRWGMMSSEVAAKYSRSSGEVTKDGAQRIVHENGTIDLLGHKWDLSTHYLPDGALDVISLRIKTATERDADALRSDLISLLTHRYGEPTHYISGEPVWDLPRTSIAVYSLTPKLIWLSYSARQGYADLDKL